MAPAPRKPAALRRHVQFTIRLTEGQADEMLKAARFQGKTVTRFCTDAVNRIVASTAMAIADEVEEASVRRKVAETMATTTRSGGSLDEQG